MLLRQQSTLEMKDVSADPPLEEGVEGQRKGSRGAPALSPSMRTSAVHRALFSGAKQLPTSSFLVVKFQDAKEEYILKPQPSMFWDSLKYFRCIDEASS